MSISAGALRVYSCYAPEDEELRNKLTKHLLPLKRERMLTTWLDVPVHAGSDLKLEVEKQLKEADLILLLISPDFIASEYCYDLQLTTALNHYEAGKVEIIPILLRPVLWEGTLIKQLPLILPTSKLPVTCWSNEDEAFKNIAIAIRDLIQTKLASKRSLHTNEFVVLNQLGDAVLEVHCPQCGTANRIGARFCKRDGIDLVSHQMIVVPKPIPSPRTKEMWIKEGQYLFSQKLYADALVAYEQALLIDPHYATAYFLKGRVFYALQQYAVALIAYEQAVRFNPHDAVAHCHKGHTLRNLQLYPEALAAYEQALQSGSLEVCAHAYNGKGRVFYALKKYTEALVAYKQALQFKQDYAEPYVNQGNVFYDLKQYPEALAAYEQALQLDSDYAAPHFFKGNIFYDRKQYPEALAAYEQALKVDSQYAAAYHGKGRVYQILGLEEEAKAAFERAALLQ